MSYSRGLLQRFGLRDEFDQGKADKVNDREAVAFIAAPMNRAVARRRGLSELRRLLEGGQAALALATADERCRGRSELTHDRRINSRQQLSHIRMNILHSKLPR